MGRWTAAWKLVKSFIGKSGKVIREAATKVAKKISFKAIGITGLGGFTIYSIYDGFGTARDMVKDFIYTVTGVELSTETMNFLVIGAVAVIIILIVRWYRRSD